MIYIYDILLNYCDNDIIYEYYEWDNNDNIENIKRIKLAYVSTKVFNDLLNYNVTVSKDFLIKIYKTCEVYDAKRIKTIDYSCLISDGLRVLAIEYDSSGHSIYKSKLLLDEEDEIAILASNLEEIKINYKKEDKVYKERYFTRLEITLRNYLLKEIEDSYYKKKYDKLKYIYQEYFDDILSSNKEMYLKLKNSLDTIDDKHKEIYNLLKLSHKKKQI